jgi:hypothetical protein
MRDPNRKIDLVEVLLITALITVTAVLAVVTFASLR